MRCLSCHIDLPENYKTCPLCGSPASEEPCVLSGIGTAPYPDYQGITPKKYTLRDCDNRPKYMLYGTVAATVTVGIISLCTTPLLWRYGVPLICAVNAFALLLSGKREKGEMLHNAVNLISLLGVQAVLLAVSLLAQNGVFEQLLAVIYTVFNLALLGITKKDRFLNQMKAWLRM